LSYALTRTGILDFPPVGDSNREERSTPAAPIIIIILMDVISKKCIADIPLKI